MKNTDYLSWDQYFMGIATLSAKRSKDPHTRVGACIVAPDNRILSVDELDTKYLYVCHAELNALLNYSGFRLQGARIYTTLFPCNECTKALIQSGIKEIIYAEDKYADTASVIAAKKMMKSAGVSYRKYENQGKELALYI